MTADPVVVDNLKANIGKLMEICQAEREAKELLLKENTELKSALQESKTAVEDAVSKYKTLQVAKSLSVGSGDSNEVKVKIHNLVREIDKCIALLNR